VGTLKIQCSQLNMVTLSTQCNNVPTLPIQKMFKYCKCNNVYIMYKMSTIFKHCNCNNVQTLLLCTCGKCSNTANATMFKHCTKCQQYSNTANATMFKHCYCVHVCPTLLTYCTLGTDAAHLGTDAAVQLSVSHSR
jgi:hypothetical protein